MMGTGSRTPTNGLDPTDDFTIHYADGRAPETVKADFGYFTGFTLDVYREQGQEVVQVASVRRTRQRLDQLWAVVAHVVHRRRHRVWVYVRGMVGWLKCRIGRHDWHQRVIPSMSGADAVFYLCSRCGSQERRESIGLLG